jgi:integrase
MSKNISPAISNMSGGQLEGVLNEHGISTEAPDKPANFGEAKEEKIRAELSAIYDRNQAAEEKAKERLTMPTTTTNDEGRPDALHETFTKSYDWLQASPQERATQRAAANLVETVRTNAAKFGVTLTDQQAMEAAMKLEAEQANSTPGIVGGIAFFSNEFHILPFLGRTKLLKLNGPAVCAFSDRLRAEARSGTMARYVIRSLGSLLSDAQERGLINRNPVHDLRSRRKGRNRKSDGEDRRGNRLVIGVDIPTPDEIKRIVGAASGRWRPLLLAAIFTGLRASELRGLRWQDIDLKKAELHVRQRADRHRKIDAPKTEAGQRTVPLPPMVVSVLREWKLACPKGPLDLAFPNGKGNVEFHVNVIQRGFWPAQIAAGVVTRSAGTVTPKYTGLHSLRHFYASWCINRKADGGLELPPKVVQHRLGHSSIMVTMDTYGHLFR